MFMNNQDDITKKVFLLLLRALGNEVRTYRVRNAFKLTGRDDIVVKCEFLIELRRGRPERGFTFLC